MLDMPSAMRVTEGCIRATASLSSDSPIAPEDVLLRLGIDNTRIDRLKTNIAGDPLVGLPSLVPPRRIDLAVLQINEGSTVDAVFTIIWRNAVLALTPTP